MYSRIFIIKKVYMRQTIYLLLFIFILTTTYNGFAGEKEIISVLYFDNINKSQKNEWLSKGIADMLITDLLKSGNIQLVERNDLQKIIKEHELSMTGLFEDKNSIKIGKLAQANKIVSGSYLIVNSKLQINSKITDVETGKIEASFSTDGNENELFKLEKEIAYKLLLKLTGVIPQNLEVPETKSLKALEYYYQGIDYLDSGKAEKAKQNFDNASNEDPFYVKPQKGLVESYELLKDYRKKRIQSEIAKSYEEIKRIKNDLKRVSVSKKSKSGLARSHYVTLLLQKITFLALKLDDVMNPDFRDIKKANVLWEFVINIVDDEIDKVDGNFVDSTKRQMVTSKLYAIYKLKKLKEAKSFAENIMQQYPGSSDIERIYANILLEMKK